MTRGKYRIWMVIMSLTALLICVSVSALAASPEVTSVSAEMGKNRVVYPQLTGLDNEEIQQKINGDMIVQGDIAGHLVTLGLLKEDGLGLVVEYQSNLSGDVLSVTIEAKGQMPDGREGQAYTALCYDLTTGGRIPFSALFTEQAQAVAFMEETLNLTLADELSGYLEYSDISPLPTDNFALSEDGITVYYPYRQLSMLSGYCGAAQFYYEELGDLLDLSEGSVLTRMGVTLPQYDQAQAREKMEELLPQGKMPHIPVAIGDPIPEVMEKYRLLRTPDRFPGGRYFQMETPEFRSVLLLSDGLSAESKDSVVEGIQTTRGELYGIRPGVTTRDEWRKVLGQPQSTVEFSESLAYDYGLPQGESDFYAFGAYQLRLHAGQDGVLHSIRLAK